MRLYECRSCSAVFSHPKHATCPACDYSGPITYNATEDTERSSNWYTAIGEIEEVLQS